MIPQTSFVFRIFLFIILVYIFLFFGYIQIADAQFFGGANTNTSLQIKPDYPKNNSDVLVSLPFTITDISGGVWWYIDGIEQTENRNQRDITITTGTLGSRTNVEAVVTSGVGLSNTYRHTIIPTDIDIIVEGKTLTPHFYKGRSLPSLGSDMTITAIPHTSLNASPKELTYEWRLNQSALFGGPVRGNNQITIGSDIIRPSIIQVRVLDRQQNVLASKAFRLPRVEPKILFYEINPLRGLRHMTLSQDPVVRGTEITIHAEPYHFDNRLLSGGYRHQWFIDRKEIDNEDSDQQKLTLTKESDVSAEANIAVTFTNPEQLLQSIEGSTKLLFNN